MERASIPLLTGDWRRDTVALLSRGVSRGADLVTKDGHSRAGGGFIWKDRLVVSRGTALGASASRREAFRRGGAVAAVIGGTAWFVKAAVIIATGDEPPVAFTIGFALFPFALLGLWSLVRNVEGRSPRIGGAIAVVAAVSVVIALLVRAVGGASVQPAEDEITVLTPFIVIAGFGTFAALVTLGVAVRRAGALAAPYTSLPWAMGLAAIPLLIAGGALETVSERLFELPIALFGLAWIALGAALWSATPRASG